MGGEDGGEQAEVDREKTMNGDQFESAVRRAARATNAVMDTIRAASNIKRSNVYFTSEHNVEDPSISPTHYAALLGMKYYGYETGPEDEVYFVENCNFACLVQDLK